MIFEIALPFLAIGCVLFLISAAIPRLRRFALSASLWCAASGFCLIADVLSLLLIGSGFAAALHDLFRRHSSNVPYLGQTSWIGWFFILFTTASTIVGATAITAIHGIIMRRLTLALFRIYVAAVSFGVGILSSAFVLLAFASHLFDMTFVATAATAALSFASMLSYLCFKGASKFRGSYPERFPIVTLEEFGFTERHSTE